MRIHHITHASFEGLGIIQDWITEKGYLLTGTHTYRGETLPDPDAFDFLIVMGGPQSASQANKAEKWPYLQDEIQLIQQTIKKNKPLLGICLGAQLIGEALGVHTERSPFREIGVFPIELLPAAKQDPVFSQFPSSFPVTHWHGDMPGIPEGANLLAQSAGCPRQAFSLGDRIYGLQFHLELTTHNIREMLQHGGDDLTPSQYVESKDQLLAHDLTEINEKMKIVLNHLAQKALSE